MGVASSEREKEEGDESLWLIDDGLIDGVSLLKALGLGDDGTLPLFGHGLLAAVVNPSFVAIPAWAQHGHGSLEEPLIPFDEMNDNRAAKTDAARAESMRAWRYVLGWIVVLDTWWPRGPIRKDMNTPRMQSGPCIPILVGLPPIPCILNFLPLRFLIHPGCGIANLPQLADGRSFYKGFHLHVDGKICHGE